MFLLPAEFGFLQEKFVLIREELFVLMEMSAYPFAYSLEGKSMSVETQSATKSFSLSIKQYVYLHHHRF